MVESGASAEDVAKSVVQLKLLEAIGEAPEKMAKGLFTYDIFHPLAPCLCSTSLSNISQLLRILAYILGSKDVIYEYPPKELLGAIRNGDEISREKLEAILSGGGINAEAAFRAALLQKVSHAT